VEDEGGRSGIIIDGLMEMTIGDEKTRKLKNGRNHT
jgi:hypothetical protein